MTKFFLFLLTVLIVNTGLGQQRKEAESLVGEGVAYHEKGDYEGAISKYDKALGLDRDNILALAEKAMTLFYMGKYEDAIITCQRAIEVHPGEKDLNVVYVTYGNCLDALKKTDRSLEIYDEGIKVFPDYYQLHYNKGITLSSVRKYDSSLLCYQNAVQINPKHASSHNAIARTQNLKNKRIPALLAYCRFFVIEPQSNRAKENLSELRKIIQGNVEKTGKKSYTIHVDADALADTAADGKPTENSFGSVDLLLSLSSGLDHDKKNKKQTEVQQFIRKFETVCAIMKETQKDNYGFYWTYYAPYFIEMYDNKMIETLAYIVFASSDDSAVKKWIKSHDEEIEKFYDWSKNFKWMIHY